LTWLTLMVWSSSPEDMESSLREHTDAVGLQLDSESITYVVVLLPSLADMLGSVRKGLPQGVVRAAGAVLDVGSPYPLADREGGSVPATGEFGDDARLLIGGDQLRSCVNDSGHSADLTAGPVCRSRYSCWMRFSHRPLYG